MHDILFQMIGNQFYMTQCIHGAEVLL